MKIYRAYKFRMYPTKEQQQKLNSFLGTSRFIYNNYLSKKETMYKEENKTYLLESMKKDLVNLQEQYSSLKYRYGYILRTSLKDLDKAYDNFFKKRGGYPKYKKKNCHESYRTVCIRSTYKNKTYSNIKIDLERRVIKLPKLEEIEIRGYRNKKSFPHKIFNATVTKEANRYYVSLCVEEEIEEITFNPHFFIGLDVGVKNLVTCSDGIKYDKIKEIEVQEKRIKGLQKALSRTKLGSNNRKKIIQKIQRAYQKIRNMRKYYIHAITTKLVKENDVITAETLKVKEMIEQGKNHLAKHISNASFSEIIRQLGYKSKWRGKRFYQVSTYYPSSQICSHCDYKETSLKDLSIREWECGVCGFINDRDLNASINIMNKGIDMYIKEQYGN